MSEKTGKKIVVTAGGVDLSFVVGLVDFNLFANSFSEDNKTTPSTIFLKTTVVADNRDALGGLIDGGYALDLAQAVISEFKPKIEIVIKK